MLKARVLCVFLIVFLCFLSVHAQDTSYSKKIFSSSIGQKFYEIAYELAETEDLNELKTEQAIIFLKATSEIDSRASSILPEIIKHTSRYSEPDRSKMLWDLLISYLNGSADLDVAGQAVAYLLDKLNSRERRERLIIELLKYSTRTNESFTSELNTLLGLLMAEKTDTEAAVSYLMEAYTGNKHNKLAFEKLVELASDQVGPAMYLEYLRLALRENPLDIEVAMSLAQYSERLELYDTAADGFKYCAELFAYLYPSQPLPDGIYLPWSLNCYNSQRGQYKCLQIAKDVRANGFYDLLLETIAAKAAEKIGDTRQANQIFKTIEGKSQQLLRGDKESSGVSFEQVAWYYCFVRPDALKALDWSNKAYAAEPNSTAAASLLAYSLVMNEQNDWAKPIIDSYHRNQISNLALAQVQLAEGQKKSAFEILKSVISEAPGSLEADKARQILTKNGGEYVASTDSGVILTALTNNFGQALIPLFVEPGNILAIQINVRGKKFSYGKDFGGILSITNNSSEPLIISDDGLFTGNIRVDADVTGDLTRQIPKIVSIKILPSLPVEPGRTTLVPLRLFAGELKELLLNHPQASLEVEFTAYIDPISLDDKKVANRLADIEPARVVIGRPGVELSTEYLRNRFSALSKGSQATKTRSATLFAGLLKEQLSMANQEPLYRFMYEDWMPEMLKSSLKYNLSVDDWVVKVHTMSELLSMPLNYDMINAVSENLNDIHWPVRLMTIYLLAKNKQSNPGKVLDWVAKYDTNELVRDMAVALGGVKPVEIKQEPPVDSNSPAEAAPKGSAMR